MSQRICFTLLTLALLFGPSGDVTAKKRKQALPPKKQYSVQVGAFDTEMKARVMEGLLEHLGEIHVQPVPISSLPPGSVVGKSKDGKWYRVLLGKFPSRARAKQYIAQKRLMILFPKPWIHVTELGKKIKEPPKKKKEEKKPDAIDVLKKDKYNFELNLFCHEEKDRKGIYKTSFTPDSLQKGQEIDLNVIWDCTPDLPVHGKYVDGGLEPSHVSVSPLLGYSILNGSGSAVTGSGSPSGVGLGGQASAFHNFGGIGGGVEYRTFSRTHDGYDFTSGPSLEHRFWTSVRFKILRRIAVETRGGLIYNRFVRSYGTSGIPTFESAWNPAIGFKSRFGILRLDRGVGMELAGGLDYLFPVSTDSLNTNSGFLYSVELRTRYFYSRKFASDWFLEFNYQTGSATGLTQSELSFILGFSFTWVP